MKVGGWLIVMVLGLGLAACGRPFGVPSSVEKASLGVPIPQPSQSVSPAPSPSISPLPSVSPGVTRRVCPSGCTYTLPSQANAAAKSGDIILIEPGVYVDCFVVNVDNLTIRGNVDPRQGIRGLPVIKNKTCIGKGIIVNESRRNLTVENLEFSGMVVADHNGAAIRHQGTGLTVRNIYAHDGEEGILSGGASGGADQILIENSVFARCGSSGHQGYVHNLYFGTAGRVTFKNSISIEAKYQGHEFKSRALDTNIECSVLANFSSVDSFSLDIPQAGTARIERSIIHQGPQSSNGAVMSLSIESLTNPGRDVIFDRNVIINDRGSGNFFNLDSAVRLSLLSNDIVGAGNLLYGKGGGTVGPNPVSNTSRQFANRAAFETGTGMSLPAYGTTPATQILPPLPTSCGAIYPPRCRNLQDYLIEIRTGTVCP